MGNLLGEPFKDYVTDQINDRQAVHGKANRTIEEIQYLNSRNAWIKLASGTSFTQDRLDLLKKNKGDQEENPLLIGVVPGQDLAIRNVLFNGLSSFGKSQLVTATTTSTSTSTISLAAGAAGAANSTYSIDTPNFTQTQRAGIAGTNRAYGVGGTGQHGYSPMPGIIDADIKDLNRGSIKKATINIKAHNRNQFDVIDALYLRLGYSVMLEWGVDKYLDGLKGGSGDVESMGTTLIDRKFWKYSKSSYNEILPEIEELREKYKGNYDGFFGVISNFSWTFEADGTYNIKLELMSQGDIIESLKANLPATKNQNQLNKYEQVKNQNLESTEEVTQDKFYNLLYPGLKELLTEWFNGGDYGFNISNILDPRKKRVPYNPTESDSVDFPKLLFGSYNNPGDVDRSKLIREGGDRFTLGLTAVPERATLSALKIAWSTFFINLTKEKKALLDATLLEGEDVGVKPSEESKAIKRKFIMENSSIEIFLTQFYNYFKSKNLAGGTEDLITIRGSEITEDEETVTEQIRQADELNTALQSTKGKNKVFEYLFNIQKEYDNPTSIKITALDKKLGLVLNPSPNNADEWNKKVGFPIYSSSDRATKFNALTPEQQEKFARKFGLTAAQYREVYINRVEGTVDFFQLTELNDVANQHFIRLGTFLEFFETNIIPKIEEGSTKGQPLLLIDYNPRTNICYVIDNSISLDPGKTIISNPEFYVGNNTFQKIYPELNKFIITTNY